MPASVAAKQNSTNFGWKSCRISTADMSKNSMMGSVILKVSLSAVLQNSLGRKPHCRSSQPATMVKNTGRVAFKLKIKFCTGISPFVSL